MNKDQNKVIQETFLRVAKDLTTLAFTNAVQAIDNTYNRKGAALQNPAVLAALISSNQAIYNNLAVEFRERTIHGANDSTTQSGAITNRIDFLEEHNTVLANQLTMEHMDNTRLRGEISELTKDFKNTAAKLSENAAAINKTSNDLMGDYKGLADQCRKLEEERDDLEEERDELRARIDELQTAMDKSTDADAKDHRILAKEYKRIESRYEDLRVKYISMMDERDQAMSLTKGTEQ